VIRRALVAMALVAVASPAAGQQPADEPTTPRFLANSQFRMGGEHLSGDDPQFVWEANFGGDVDLLDWGSGRATFVANYQVMLGEEFKSFDPNQGNYILGGSGSIRLRRTEFSGVFHHESRHLADRLKQSPAVDWNMIGARAQRRIPAGVMFLDVQGQWLGVIQKSFVDYNWQADGRVRGDIVIRPSVGVLLELDLKVLGVDGTQSRGTQTGVRAEGGVRIDGEMGALELFLAVERRVDPAVLAFGTKSWFAAGFRLLSR
jgi:hypothetical protein